MRCPTLSELPPPPSGKIGWPWTAETSPLYDTSEIPDVGGHAFDWSKITIVTPSYNQGQYLEETIRSVLLQGYPNLEYIIVDDASTDRSVDIIRKYEKYLTWWGVNEKNSGQSYALNKGFTHATGDIHAYLNSDDCYEPGALYACTMAFKGGQQWIVGQVRFFQEGIGYGPVPQLPGKSFSDWFVCCPISQPGCFWAAELHSEVGPFCEDLNYFMDYEFWLRFRVIKRIKPFVIDQLIATYRLHPQSKTVAHTSAFALEGRPIREHYKRFLTRGQQVWLFFARRHRKARMRGSKAVSLLKQGEFWSAIKELISAFMAWPLCLFDLRGIWLAYKEFAGRKKNIQAVSSMWPEWDD